MFTLRHILEAAEPENNADATLDFTIASEYDSDTNNTPLILVITLIAVYIIVFAYLDYRDRKKRRQGFHEQSTVARDIHAFALSYLA